MIIKHFGRLLTGSVAFICLYGAMEIIDFKSLSKATEIITVVIAVQVIFCMSYCVGYIAELLMKGME